MIEDTKKLASLVALFEVPEILHAQIPDIAKHVAAGIMRVPGVIVLGDTDGMAVFYHEGGGSYDGHYLFPPWTRGPLLLDRCRDFLEDMFTKHGAKRIRGQTPVENRAAKVVNRALGFQRIGMARNSFGQECNQYQLTREDWLQRNARPTT